MKALLFILALICVPSFATYGNGAGAGALVAAHEQIVTDAYLDASNVNAADYVDQLVEMCNQYANQRVVVLNVHHNNNAQVVRVVRARQRVALRNNVRVVFVANNRRVVAHKNQVRVVVRGGRARLFSGIFNAGFRAVDRARAQRVLAVRVRG